MGQQFLPGILAPVINDIPLVFENRATWSGNSSLFNGGLR